MVGLGRLELPTSRLSGVRSNQAELQARNNQPLLNLSTGYQLLHPASGLALERDAKTAVHLGAMVFRLRYVFHGFV